MSAKFLCCMHFISLSNDLVLVVRIFSPHIMDAGWPFCFFLITVAIFTLPIWWAQQPAGPYQYWFSPFCVWIQMNVKKKKSISAFVIAEYLFFFQQNIWDLYMNYDMWDIQWVTAGWAFVARTPSLPGSNRKKQSIHTKQCKVGALIVFFSFIAQKRHADSRRNEHARNSSRSFRLL